MAGIGKIETKLKSKLEAVDKNISVAFQDLSQLITMAKEMTRLSQSIASKIKDYGSQVTDDETVLFKSHLLELGIEQQVDVGLMSRSNYSNTSKYYTDLAKQISSIVRPIMDRHKRDQLTLSDVYCCFNRARGVDLVSPDDILEACKIMETIPDIQLKMVRYKSGLLVIQNQSCDTGHFLDETVRLVKNTGSLTPLQLASRLAIPIQLARQWLVENEELGELCRDESIEGLRFYPNKFIQKESRLIPGDSSRWIGLSDG